MFFTALAFRVALFYSGFVDIDYNTNDSWQYLDMGRSLLRGTFAQDGVITMNRTPGYPAFLAAVFALFGESQLSVTASQMVLDALSCVMVLQMGLWLGVNRWAAGLTAVMVATCLFTATYTTQALTETVYTFVLTLGLWVLLLPSRAGSEEAYGTTTSRVLLSGLVFGFGVLVRPSMALAALPFAALMLLRSVLMHGWRGALSLRRLAAPAAFSAGLLVLVLPWMARNYLTFPAQYGAPDEQVTLLGMKSGIPTYKHVYTKEFNAFLRSQEEPYVQTEACTFPVVARFVYPEETQDLKRAFAKLEHDVKTTSIYRKESLPAFVEITRKRYAAAPRLYVTAPLSKFLKIWIAPRISVLWKGTSGHNSGRGLIVLMTLYSTFYVGLGFLGLTVGLRQASPVAAVYLLSQILGHSLTYMYIFPTPQSRYAVPVFPLFCLAAGLLASHAHKLASARWKL